jgi:hypothetical protein
MFEGPVGRRLGACLAAAVIVLPASHAVARGWAFRGWGGRGYSRSVTAYNNGGGNFGRTVTTTGPGGRTATSAFNRSVSNGTITDSRTFTGFNGDTASGTLTRTPGQGGTATWTGRGGQTWNYSYAP